MYITNLIKMWSKLPFVLGGNRNKLESSGNIVQHNEFEQFSRVGAAGNDAISVSGEGHTVAHNHIHDGEAGAIGFYVGSTM
jgi:hypothetical protein